MLSHRILENFIEYTTLTLYVVCYANRLIKKQDYLEIKFNKTHFSKNVFFYSPHPPPPKKPKEIEKRNKIIDFINIVFVF